MPRLLHVQNWEYCEIFSIPAFFSATLYSDCKCYTDPAKLQTHKMEHKDKQEISSQHHGGMVLCCARIYLVTLSDREYLILSSHKCSCHSDCPGTLSSAHLCFGLGTSSKPSGCLTQLFWGQRSTSRRNVSLGLECYCSSGCMFWVIGHSLTVLGADSRWRRCHPPLHSPLPQVWGWSCRCVWGKRGLRKSFRALTPGQIQPTSFDVHENFSPYFLPRWYFSHFWSDCFLNNSKSWNSFGSKSNRLFHFT